MEGNSACSLSILNVSIKKITGPLGEGAAGGRTLFTFSSFFTTLTFRLFSLLHMFYLRQ